MFRENLGGTLPTRGMESPATKEPRPEHTPCPKITDSRATRTPETPERCLSIPPRVTSFSFCVFGCDDPCRCCNPVILTAFCVALSVVVPVVTGMVRYRIAKICNHTMVLRTIIDWAVSEIEFVSYFG